MEFSLKKAIYNKGTFVTEEERSEYRMLSNAARSKSSVLQHNDTDAFRIPTETRALTAFGESVHSVVKGLHEGVRDNSILNKLGAEFIYPNAPVNVPDYSGINAEWKPVGESANGDNGQFQGRFLTPKRLTVKLTYTEDFFLLQTPETDAILMKDIVNAINSKLQQTIFGNHAAGSKDIPNGLLSSVPMVAELPSKASTMAMKAKVLKNNASADTVKYITNSEGYALLEQTPIIAGGDVFLLKDKELNNYPILETNALVSVGEKKNQHPLICADWSKLVIAQFGIEVRMNPFSKAHEGCIEVIANGYFDYCFRSQDWIERKLIKSAE